MVTNRKINKYHGILLEKYSTVSDNKVSGFLSCCCRLARRTVFQLAKIVLSTFFSASGVAGCVHVMLSAAAWSSVHELLVAGFD